MDKPKETKIEVTDAHRFAATVAKGTGMVVAAPIALPIVAVTWGGAGLYIAGESALRTIGGCGIWAHEHAKIVYRIAFPKQKLPKGKKRKRIRSRNSGVDIFGAMITFMLGGMVGALMTAGRLDGMVLGGFVLVFIYLKLNNW
jgi:hypothetical protein